MIRKSLIFKGSVQGVGFRYRAKYAAEKFNITGWVKNCWDGSVSMEAQGSPADLDQMIEWLQHQPFIDIENIQSKDIPLDGNCNIFEIRR